MGKPTYQESMYPEKGGETWRIEISQQPEEKKAKAIPKVVTSEIGGT